LHKQTELMRKNSTKNPLTSLTVYCSPNTRVKKRLTAW